MFPPAPPSSIDYLAIGHLTRDLSPDGPQIGGTAAYASLTARALGLRVGVVTSWGEDLPLGELEGIPITNLLAERSTTFENIETPEGRRQVIHHAAPSLSANLIPDHWRSAPIVHLGPVAQEVDPNLARQFPDALVGLTPQGWLREWGADGKVNFGEWPEAAYVLEQASAVVISEEDLLKDQSRIDAMAAYTRLLVVTHGEEGACLYTNGEMEFIPQPNSASPGYPVGAGDIFAASFFIRLHASHDPVEAIRFAHRMAAFSITRPGLDGIPTQDEIYDTMTEAL